MSILGDLGTAIKNKLALKANIASPTFTGVVTAPTFSGSLNGNATTAGGLAVATGTNNVANQIVRTDGNGYIQCGYIQSSGGNEHNASNPAYVWGTNGSDNYMRTYDTSSMHVQGATKINPLSGDSNYKLCYTADGQRTNAGEWGRAVMRYEPNGQTYGIRVDRADYADSAGSATTAIKLANSSGDWSASGAIANVVGMLAWKNYSNGHVIFDASAGTAPNGAAISNVNAAIPWSASYPTLMGWNGGSTFGVRVDSARVADSASYATTAAVGTSTTQIATTEFVLANSGVSFTAGTKLEAQALNEVSNYIATYQKRKEIAVSTGGTITVSFRLRAVSTSYSAYGQIYVNDVAVGTNRSTNSGAYVTYTENITIAAGDLVQLYIKGSGYSSAAAAADQFKILVAKPSTSYVYIN